MATARTTGEPDLKLPNDQQAMQDSLAESANQARSATDVADDVAIGAITTREGLSLGAKVLNFGSKLIRGKQLIGGAMLRSRIPYVGTALLADYATKAYRKEIQGIDDGKGLFALAGEDLGNRIGNKMYGAEMERMSQPITQEELEAYRRSRNIPEPVVDVASPVPTPDIPKRGVGAPEIAPNVAPDVPVVNPDVAPEITPNVPVKNLQEAFDASGQMGIGIAPQYGQLSDEDIMKQRQLRADSSALPPMDQTATRARIAELYGLDAPATLNQAMTNNPNAVMDTDAQGRIRSFENRQAREKNITDTQAELEQASLERQAKIGGTGSYEGDSRARSGLETPPAGTETPPEAPASPPETPTPPSLPEEAPAPPKSPEQSPAPAGTPEEQKTPDQSEYDLEVAEEEQALIERAQEKGYTQEQIDKMLGGVRERRAEAEDKEQLEKLLQILQLEKMMIGNALLKQKLGEPIVEEPSIGEISTYEKYLVGRGIKRDPNTNAFTVTEEGFFADSEEPLNPLSAIFQEMLGNEVGRYLLNLAPPELLQAKNAGELEQGVPYQVDDGRIFGFDGEDLRVIIDFGSLFNETLEDAEILEETEEE